MIPTYIVMLLGILSGLTSALICTIITMRDYNKALREQIEKKDRVIEATTNTAMQVSKNLTKLALEYDNYRSEHTTKDHDPEVIDLDDLD